MDNKKDILIPLISIVIIGLLVAIGFYTSSTTPRTTITENKNLNWPSQELEKMIIEEKTESYIIKASYPKTTGVAISESLKSHVDTQIAQFKDDTRWYNEVDIANNQTLTLDITYEFISSVGAQNYIFKMNSYTGGAHGFQIRNTFAYNNVGKLLSISDVFSDESTGLKILSAYVQKELLKREGADRKWISDGAGNNVENYKTFIIKDDSVTVLFDPYQVAPYSDGSIDIEVPIGVFSKIANPQIFTNITR